MHGPQHGQSHHNVLHCSLSTQPLASFAPKVVQSSKASKEEISSCLLRARHHPNNPIPSRVITTRVGYRVRPSTAFVRPFAYRAICNFRVERLRHSRSCAPPWIEVGNSCLQAFGLWTGAGLLSQHSLTRHSSAAAQHLVSREIGC